ncbi:MAG: ABC transporter permease [Anaerolineales bacterium]|nr:ABC transporter permease [Anaerolineales bacterium]
MQSSLPTLSGINATWSAFWAMVKKELIVMARYPVQFVTSFLQVFIIIAVLALSATMFSKGAIDESTNTSGVVAYGFVLFLFLSDTLWTIGVNVRHEQVQGTLEQLYLAPASKFANLVSRVMNLLIWTGAISIVSTLGLAAILGKLPFKNPLLGLFLLLMSLSGTFGIGFAFAALTLRIKETAQTVANLAQFAFMIFCACFFPFSALPTPLLYFSKLIPLSYSVDIFRSTLMGYPAGFPELAPASVEIVIVTTFGILMPFLGYWLYRKAEDQARHSGSLAQF